MTARIQEAGLIVKEKNGQLLRRFAGMIVSPLMGPAAPLRRGFYRGVAQRLARAAHNRQVGGSNPSAAIVLSPFLSSVGRGRPAERPAVRPAPAREYGHFRAACCPPFDPPACARGGAANTPGYRGLPGCKNTTPQGPAGTGPHRAAGRPAICNEVLLRTDRDRLPRTGPAARPAILPDLQFRWEPASARHGRGGRLHFWGHIA